MRSVDSAVSVDIPAQVCCQCFVEACGHMRGCHSSVMFKALFANEAHETLQVLNVGNGFRSECVERIVCELPFPNERANVPAEVVCADTCVSKRACRCPSC